MLHPRALVGPRLLPKRKKWRVLRTPTRQLPQPGFLVRDPENPPACARRGPHAVVAKHHFAQSTPAVLAGPRAPSLAGARPVWRSSKNPIIGHSGRNRA